MRWQLLSLAVAPTVVSAGLAASVANIVSGLFDPGTPEVLFVCTKPEVAVCCPSDKIDEGRTHGWNDGRPSIGFLSGCIAASAPNSDDPQLAKMMQETEELVVSTCPASKKSTQIACCQPTEDDATFDPTNCVLGSSLVLPTEGDEEPYVIPSERPFTCKPPSPDVKIAAVCCPIHKITEESGKYASVDCLYYDVAGTEEPDVKSDDWPVKGDCGNYLGRDWGQEGLCCLNRSPTTDGRRFTVSECTTPAELTPFIPLSDDEKAAVEADIHQYDTPIGSDSPTAFSCESFDGMADTQGGKMAFCCPEEHVKANENTGFDVWEPVCSYKAVKNRFETQMEAFWSGHKEPASWNDCGAAGNGHRGLCCNGAAFGMNIDGTNASVSECKNAPPRSDESQ